MRHKAKHLLAAFALAVLLILALAGFLAVDLSAARDMRDGYEPILRLFDVRPDGMTLSLFGRRYSFLPEKLEPLKEVLWGLRALLPVEARIAGEAVARICEGGS